MPTTDILLLDPSASMHRAVVTVMAGMDVSITPVGTRAAFAAALAERRFDVVIADFQDNGMLPAEAPVLARSHQPETPFIYLSSLAGEEIAVDAIRAGAADYILKSRLDRLPDRLTLALESAAQAVRQRRTEAQLRTLIGELRHRLKNTLAAVSALNWLTRKHSQTMEQFHLAFTGRIEALSQAHELLFETTWKPAELRQVFERALKPFLTGAGSLSLSGDPVAVSPKHALGLTLVVHELATNAVKYGALSQDGGQVALRWAVSADHPRRIDVRWAESGGPPVSPPARRGFGSTLIDRTVADELGGSVETHHLREGLVCAIAFDDDPVDWEAAELDDLDALAAAQG